MLYFTEGSCSLSLSLSLYIYIYLCNARFNLFLCCLIPIPPSPPLSLLLACTHTYGHTYVQIKHTSVHSCVRANMHRIVHSLMHTCMRACIHTYMYGHMLDVINTILYATCLYSPVNMHEHICIQYVGSGVHMFCLCVNPSRMCTYICLHTSPHTWVSVSAHSSYHPNQSGSGAIGWGDFGFRVPYMA